MNSGTLIGCIIVLVGILLIAANRDGFSPVFLYAGASVLAIGLGVIKGSKVGR